MPRRSIFSTAEREKPDKFALGVGHCQQAFTIGIREYGAPGHVLLEPSVLGVLASTGRKLLLRPGVESGFQELSKVLEKEIGLGAVNRGRGSSAHFNDTAHFYRLFSSCHGCPAAGKAQYRRIGRTGCLCHRNKCRLCSDRCEQRCFGSQRCATSFLRPCPRSWGLMR